ncbi:MAG: hypothetical protein N2644_08675 [Candidatus Sumerlaea chitinivorans]|jgi:hypothetical protein|nr:hypothetical protein [Candidatus Sumerlaea chitinivorans]
MLRVAVFAFLFAILITLYEKAQAADGVCRVGHWWYPVDVHWCIDDTCSQNGGSCHGPYRERKPGEEIDTWYCLCL